MTRKMSPDHRRSVNLHGKPLPETLTTGQAAQLLEVSRRLITEWADRGLIAGAYRMPPMKANGPQADTGDRRIPTGSLLAFCREHGILCPDSLRRNVTIYCCGRSAATDLGNLSPVVWYTCPYRLCLDLARGLMTVICLDAAYIGRGATVSLLQALQAVNVARCWKLVVLHGEDDSIEEKSRYSECGALQVVPRAQAGVVLAEVAWGMPLEVRIES